MTTPEHIRARVSAALTEWQQAHPDAVTRFLRENPDRDEGEEPMNATTALDRRDREEQLPALQGVWDDSRIALVRKMYCKGASQEEFEVFIETCKRTGLSPLMKQIYCIMRTHKNVEQMTIQVGIDGFRLIADRTGRYVPGREANYTYDEKGKVATATAYVKKLVGGEWHEIAATVRWEEFAAGGNFWQTMPHHQLAKVAEAHALRRAFPADLSGLYITEEMDQADREPAPRVTESRPALSPRNGSALSPGMKAAVGRWKAIKARAQELGVDLAHCEPSVEMSVNEIEGLLAVAEGVLTEEGARREKSPE